MTSELTYETLNFMNIYLLRINSLHLSSAKHMPWFLNIRVLSFWFRILILGSFPFVPPPNIARASGGVQMICAHYAEGEQTEKILIFNFEEPY